MNGPTRNFCTEALASVGLEGEAAREQAGEIKQLADMSPLDYCRVRKTAARRLKIGVGQLDRLVRDAQKARVTDDNPQHWAVEPAGEAVDGIALLDDIKKVFACYIVLPKGASEALALWVLHAWTMDAGDVSPFLALVSPTKRCGKTNTLIVLYYLTPRSELASNISASALFRYIEEVQPTLLIDEADSFLKDNEEMRGILNSGHTKTAAHVIRNVEVNGEHKPRRFSTWSPKAIATIQALADTLEDRAIVLQLQRKARTANVDRLRRRDNDEFALLRRQAARWAADNFSKLTDPEPDIPVALNDRAADNWRPLLAIADLAGGTWPRRAREAACLLSGEGQDSTSVNVELLADIRLAFREADVLRSADLVAKLVEDPERPWATWRHGKPLTQKQLAGVLRPFGIISETVSIPGLADAKGYKRVRFEHAWEVYLPAQNSEARPFKHSDPSKRRNADGLGGSGVFSSVGEDSGDGSKNAEMSHGHAGFDASTNTKPRNGAKSEFNQEGRPDTARRIIAPARRMDRLCDHCGGTERLADPVRRWNWPGRPDGVLLHRRCEMPWYDQAAQGAPQPATNDLEDF
jgi:putative DNA primase/helicase